MVDTLLSFWKTSHKIFAIPQNEVFGQNAKDLLLKMHPYNDGRVVESEDVDNLLRFTNQQVVKQFGVNKNLHLLKQKYYWRTSSGNKIWKSIHFGVRRISNQMGRG